uniref:Excinuclease ABC subunit C n=1 Tax=Thermodesulfobacterium geofontis TaxID=1295609 RepID=A0A7C4JT99_9BACT
MYRLSENLEFERAAFLRDRIEDLKKVLETQAVVLDTPLDLDLWEYKKDNSNEYFIVLFVRYGYLYGFQTFQIKNPLGEKPALKEVILQFYMEGKIIPEKIFLPEKPEEKEELESILSELSGKEIKILESLQDEKIKILRDLALKNLENFILSEKRREKPWYAGLSEELVEVLRLSREPRWIEAIDLSQFYGTARVGAIVCFFEGEPEKSRYRHYHIKGEGKDDYAMLYEVVYRRLKRGLEEESLPDLILIDGGKGHLETALRAGEDLEVKDVEFRAIAKNEKRQPEKLYIPGRKNPLFLPKYKEVYHFIGRIMSEAHRFAKTFAEKTKEKETLTSILDRIKGIGPKRKEILLENFKDLEEILNAPLEKLSNLPGFNLKIAKTLKKELQKEYQKF